MKAGEVLEGIADQVTGCGQRMAFSEKRIQFVPDLPENAHAKVQS